MKFVYHHRPHHSTSAPHFRSSPTATPRRTTDSGERGHPLGIDVVPEVYIMMYGSRGDTARALAQTSSSDTAEPCLRNASRPTKPGADRLPIMTTCSTAGASGSGGVSPAAASASAGTASDSRATKSTYSSTTSVDTSTFIPESAIT